jgi:hypothetical protein
LHEALLGRFFFPSLLLHGAENWFHQLSNPIENPP